MIVLEVTNMVRFLLILLLPIILLSFAFYLKSKNLENWIVRKYIHTTGLFVIGVVCSVLESLGEILLAIIIIASSLIILSLPPMQILQKITNMGTRDGESQLLLLMNGFVTSGVAVILLIVFFDHKWIFFGSLLSVAFGDGLGEFIGKPFGRHKYKLFSQKSVEGSLGVLIGCIFGGILATITLYQFNFEIFMIVLFASIVATIIEGLSALFIDNILMPFSYGFILWYYLV